MRYYAINIFSPNFAHMYQYVAALRHLKITAFRDVFHLQHRHKVLNVFFAPAGILGFIISKMPDKNVATAFINPLNPSLHPITGLKKTPGYYAARQSRALPESRLSLLSFRAVSGARGDPRATENAVGDRSLCPLIPGTTVTIARLGRPDRMFVYWIRDIIQRARSLFPGNYQPAPSNSEGCTKPVPLMRIMTHHVSVLMSLDY